MGVAAAAGDAYTHSQRHIHPFGKRDSHLHRLADGVAERHPLCDGHQNADRQQLWHTNANKDPNTNAVRHTGE